jgi:hypothetical protein
MNTPSILTPSATGITRKWTPADYCDEVSPQPRATPSDWIVPLPDGRYGMAKNEQDFGAEDADPATPGCAYVLNDGDLVKFSWTEDHGTADFTVFDPAVKPDADQTWMCEREMPVVEGGCSMVAALFDWDTMAFSMAEFATHFDEVGTNTVAFWVVSQLDTEFVFRDGKFHEVAAEAA